MTKPVEQQIVDLKQAITAQEILRSTLGDAAVAAMIATAQMQLVQLKSHVLLPEQRKHVTVLFCDLVGFAPMAEKLDPKEVREILNLYFAPWRQAIARYGGVLEKFIGDAVMAVFGIFIYAQTEDASTPR